MFIVAVGVAHSRPPKHDKTVHCLVEVDVSGKTPERAENEARLIACQIAASHKNVVMPVSAQVIKRTEAEGEDNG